MYFYFSYKCVKLWIQVYTFSGYNEYRKCIMIIINQNYINYLPVNLLGLKDYTCIVLMNDIIIARIIRDLM